MSTFFQQFFEDTCKNVLSNHLGELSDEVTYQEIRIDLAEYARLTGVQIVMKVVGPRHLNFSTWSQDVQYFYDYQW
ncbi:hypothetical protein [Xanthomonas phage X1]|nr:hypothetical protein [Xanthomonas phage X1]